MARITTIPLFKGRSLSAGDACTSDVIDLRYSANQGYFSLYHKIAAGTSTTCGTTVFTYKEATLESGPYLSPSASIPIGTAGSHGTYGTSNMWTFEPELAPWMRIVATQTGAGTAGANTVINSLELNIQ